MSTATDFTTTEMILIEQQVQSEAPSVGAAYLLALLLGLLSAHRFYLGRPGSAILQILSYFVVIGFFWWVIDLFSIPGMVRAKKARLRAEIMTRMRPELAHKAPPPPIEDHPAYRMAQAIKAGLGGRKA